MPKIAGSRMRDGAELLYTLRESGKPDAPRLTLVHSLALDRSIWDGVIAALGGDVDVLTYDCRGHGASSKPPGPYTTELFAGDLRDLYASIGWTSSFIAGASMGGSITLQFVASFPEMVEGLALFDTTAWYGPDAPASWHERGRKALEDGLASLIAFQQTRWFSDAFRANHPEVGEHFAQVFVRNELPAYAATCDMLGNFDLRSKLPAIDVPVEIAVGEEDYATPPDMARTLHAGIAGSHLTIVPSARHLTPIEIPELVAATIKTVIARKGEGVANRR